MKRKSMSHAWEAVLLAQLVSVDSSASALMLFHRVNGLWVMASPSITDQEKAVAAMKGADFNTFYALVEG